MNKIKIIKTLASVAVLALASNSAWADGTIAGTGVDNTASISYSVSGTAQADIESSETGNSTPGIGAGTPTSFLVDKKVDVDVTAAATSQNIVPGGTATHTFTVTNEGNDIEFFALDTLDATAGDIFDVASCTTTVGAVTGGLPSIPASELVPAATAAVSSTASPLRLGPDGTATVTMVCTAPADNAGAPLVNTNDADVSLVATATVSDGGAPLTETTGADTAGVDVVLADAAGSATGDILSDASHSATVANVINTADLTVRKESAVISDPINGNTNPKRIPDAVIEYTITVSNQAAEADHIVISDIIPADLTFASCTFTGGIVNAVAPSPTLGCSEASGTVSSSSFTLEAGTVGTPTTAVLTINATIN